MRTFFTADTHFFHAAVIGHCKRPYANLEDMHADLILRWNKTVGPKDEIYILGDFSFGNIEKTLELLKKLNGRKYLVAGNHDKGLLKKKDFIAQFKWVKDLARIKVRYPDVEATPVQQIVLCHYAMRVWEKSHYGVFHFHGHSHGSLTDLQDLSLDVGVDNAYKILGEYRPFSFEELRDIMAGRSWKPVDHHTEREKTR